MRKILIALALLALAALLGFALRGGTPRGSALAPPPAAEAPARPDSAHAIDAPAAAPASAERQAQPAAGTQPGAEPRAEAAAALVELHGTIVAIDENGLEHAHEDGEFELVGWKGPKGREQRVEVHGGSWSASLAREVELGVQNAKLGGRSAVLEGELVDRPLRRAIPADGVVALRVRWLRPLRLFVRDRRTNLDLADVTLVRAEGWPRTDLAHPGDVTDARVLARSRRSPVLLDPPAARELALHVGSPGCAWVLVKLDAAEGGDRYVTLEPSGELEVELDAAAIDKSTVLRVRSSIGLVVGELDIGERRKLVFDGIPAGNCSVSAEIGPWYRDPIGLGKLETEVRAGERTRVVLTLAAAPKDVSVALGGEVVVPRAWGAKRFLLTIELLDPPLGGREAIRRLSSDEMRADGERAGVWHWRMENVQAGEYQLCVWNYSCSLKLHVPETGLEDVRLLVPEPCDAFVRVVDAASGAEARVEHLSWNARRPEGIFGGGALPAEWDETLSRWKLRAPRGEIELHTLGGDFKAANKLVELREGRNEIVLEVTRQYSVLLKLSQAGNAVHWPDVVEIKLRPKEGGAETGFWCSGREDVRVPFEKPGTWILTLPEILGYEPIPPFEVRVEADRGTEHTIELVPKG